MPSRSKNKERKTLRTPMKIFLRLSASQFVTLSMLLSRWVFKKLFLGICFGLFLSLFLSLFSMKSSFSAVTRFLKDDSMRDFEKGNLDGVSLDQEGFLRLAPKVRELFREDDILFIWNSAEDKEGNLYFGTGNKARLYQRSLDGTIKEIYESDKGTAISSLAIDSKDNLYLSVNPLGQIIRISLRDPEKTPLMFTQLQEQYIWKIRVDSNDHLWIATGHTASLFQVDPKGQKKKIYSSNQESHFLALFIDSEDRVYFAGEGTGSIYQYNNDNSSPESNPKVLYDPYEDEVKEIIGDNKGNLYFATATNRPKKTPNTFDYTDTFVLEAGVQELEVKPRQTTITIKKKQVPVKNSVYQIDSDGLVQKLFTRDQTAFLSLTLNEEGYLYAGSDQDGILYRIEGVNQASIFLQTQETQILSLLSLQNIQNQKNEKKLLVSTGRMAKLLEVDLNFPNQGIYESQILNARGSAFWGKIDWDAKREDQIRFLARSGNSKKPDSTWTQWENIDPETGKLDFESQYMQYRVKFQATNSDDSPILKMVQVSYLLENRAPEISRIRLKKDKEKQLETFGPFHQSLPPSVFTLSWRAFDRDSDFLNYDIQCKQENSKQWISLSSDWYEKEFSFDSRRLADGEYVFRVSASDVKSNGEKRKKTVSSLSSVFKIDNSFPRIEGIQVQQTNNNNNKEQSYLIRGKAVDQLSHIQVLQYSLNGADWVYLSPKDLIYDSQEEEFEIQLNMIQSTPLFQNQNILILRVADAQGNFITQEVQFGTSSLEY